MEAKNKANQGKLNKVVKALVRYNELNRKREEADDNDRHAETRKLDRQCENAFDKFQNYLDELPKYEQQKVLKSELY